MQTARLKRIEVTGGFLSDLDLELVPGLNVVIGARGAGKTSLLELVRFALGVPAITPEASGRTRTHARGVLAHGSVSVTVVRDGGEITTARDIYSDVDDPPDFVRALRPLVVSQREIEEIGLNGASRMHILDGLVGEYEAGTEVELLAEIEAAAVSLNDLLQTMERGKARMVELADLEQQLVSTEREAGAQGAASAQLEAEQVQLGELSGRLARLSGEITTKQELVEALQSVRGRVGDVNVQIKELRNLDQVNPERECVARATTLLLEAHAEITAALATVERQHGEEAAQVTDIRRELRDRSEKIEALQAGAGDLARKLTRLREEQAERRQIAERLEVLEKDIASGYRQRNELLEQLERFRQRRFEWRQKRARAVVEMFDGEIEVRLKKNGQRDRYEAALAEALDGSGLQHRALARKLAPRIGPQALVRAVERRDSTSVAEHGQITRERAERLVSHLRANGSAGVLSAPLDDAVDYALLDGDDYKPTGVLSTGQRCTVILPLLMAQNASLIVLDQPEDHLDNACIVDTLVRAMLARKTGRQLIVATHNANIPVLGGADQVIVLSSDGQHGHVAHVGGLDDPEIVRSITGIMEGGEAAFRRRAEFYAGHSQGIDLDLLPELPTPA